jgi:parallel beta-helix repeat protein
MSGNTYNFGVCGDTLSHHVQNIDESNFVNGKPVYYWINQQNKQVPDDAGFVGIINSVNITVRDLILTNNSMGVLFVHTNNSRIENVTANLNDGYGIYLICSSNDNLTNNTVSYNNNHGICLDESSNNSLTCNTVNSNNEYDIDGIHLKHSDYNTLENNTASNSYCGIHIDYSGNNKLAGNNASGNDGGISMTHGSNDNTLADNIANSNEWYGIAIDSSNNNNLSNNTANTNDHYGISMYKSSSNTITGNTLSDNNPVGDTGSGIWMYDSDNNNLEKNTVNLNDYGIRMEYSDNNIISCNWVYKNSKRGFYLSSGGIWNNISYNNIIENGQLQLDGSYHWNFYNGHYTVEARNNYWGTTNITLIDAGICDDDEGWGIVSFYPPACEPVPCAPAPELHGDANHDGKLSTADAVLALQMAVGSIDIDSVADMNSNGKITSLDALMILQAAAELRI